MMSEARLASVPVRGVKPLPVAVMAAAAIGTLVMLVSLMEVSK